MPLTLIARYLECLIERRPHQRQDMPCNKLHTTDDQGTTKSEFFLIALETSQCRTGVDLLRLMLIRQHSLDSGDFAGSTLERQISATLASVRGRVSLFCERRLARSLLR